MVVPDSVGVIYFPNTLRAAAADVPAETEVFGDRVGALSNQ